MKNTGPTQRVRDAVILRDDFSCRRCGRMPASQIHHRAPRGRGGTQATWINLPSNLLLLCIDCHEHVERNRSESYQAGLLIRRTSTDLPEQVPVTNLRGDLLLFTDDGDVIHLPHKESA